MKIQIQSMTSRKDRAPDIKQNDNKKKRKLSGDDDDSNSGISSNSLSDSEGEEKGNESFLTLKSIENQQFS